MAVIQHIFPERQVVGVGDKILAKSREGVQCITQQVPIFKK